MTLPFGVLGDSLLHAVEYEIEEDEEEVEETNPIKYQFKGLSQDNKELQCDLLILSIGIAACSFISTYIDIPTHACCEIVEENSTHSKRKKTSKLYCSDNVVYVQCGSIPDSSYSKSYIRTLFSSIKPSQVVILSNASKAKRFNHNDDDNGEDLLRCLLNSYCACAVSTPLLEEGLLISGLSAAAFSHCEQTKVPAIAYVNYMESHFVDVFTLKTFAHALKDEILIGKLKMVEEKKVLHKLKSFEGISGADKSVFI